MKKCAYCNEEYEKLTKEHIFSKMFLSKFHQNGLGYNHSLKDYTANYPIINDVCQICNNGILSTFDNYIIDFYRPIDLLSEIGSNYKFKLQYNFDLLSKWLMKTWYNSERKNGYSEISPIMPKYREYIMGKNTIDSFEIYVELLSDIPESIVPRDFLAKVNDHYLKLKFLKIGSYALLYKNRLNTDIGIKYLLTGNLVFHLFSYDNNDLFYQQQCEYLSYFRNHKLFLLKPKSDEITLESSNLTVLDYIDKTFEGF